MKKSSKKRKKLTKKEIFKETIHKLSPGIILIFVISFMFFIYEPLLMYSTNINDFWFDFSTLFSSNIVIFLCFFMFLMLIYIGIFFIDKAYIKNNKLLNILTVILFGLFIMFYIQGNYLISDLPKLDGSAILWNMYSTQNFISIILFAIISISLVILCYKFKIEKVVNTTKYISLTIFAMLFISLFTTVLTTENVFDSKKSISITNRNFENYSSDENFIIFVTDVTDSLIFHEVLENSDKYSDIFNDFTYYPDTVAGYTFTSESIPFIFSSKWYKNETSFKDYSTKSFNESKLLNTLKNNDFDLNIYGKGIIWDDNKAKNISNFDILNNKINNNKLFIEETKYIMFKYLPFPFKRYSDIETMDYYSVNEKEDEDNLYSFYDCTFYARLKEMKFKKIKDKQFKFIHIEGAHVPYNYDKDVNIITNGTYEQKVEATLTIVATYINKLKELGVYDNSNIIVMADHGYNYDDTHGRQNPILYIKGINEEHEMNESELPISYEDLSDAYLDLIEGKQSNELFENVDKDRERRYMFYHYTKEHHMIEYIQKGKAWDEDTLVESGKIYDR